MEMKDRILKFNNIMPIHTRIDRQSLIDMNFFTAPASTKFHENYEGGLFDHSLKVTQMLIELTEKLDLEWERPESPYIIGMYHDLCKCDNYEWDFEHSRYTYNNDQIIPGHAEKSIIMLQHHLRLTDEEVACIRWHMGAYETDTKMWEYYDRAIKKYHNVLFTHMADMIASKIIGI